MGIENAKLVAIPVITFSKEEVLNKMDEKCCIALDIISEARDFEIPGFNIPICLGTVVDNMLDVGDKHYRCSIPTQEEIREMIDRANENYAQEGYVTVASVVDYYWDGETFHCDVCFKDGATNG